MEANQLRETERLLRLQGIIINDKLITGDISSAKYDILANTHHEWVRRFNELRGELVE